MSAAIPRASLRFLALGVAVVAFGATASAKSLSVTPDQIERLKITLGEVRPATSEAIAVLPATVVPPPNGRVAVAAPFAGTVLRSDVLIGQEVKKGQLLVTIASRDLLETLSRLKQAEAELHAAEVVAERYRFLAERNITSRSRAEETAAQASKARAVVEQNRRQSQINNIAINEDGTYTVSAPTDGRVVETRATAGGSLETLAAAAVIDTSNELWVEAQVPAKLVGRIKPGDAVVLGNGASGKVVSIGGALDPMTRSAAMLVKLPADSGLVSGQMVTLTVTQEAAKGAVSVPRAAVTFVAGEPVVFLRTEAGFSVTPVKIRGRSAELATIEGEVRPGRHVASSGLALLEKMSAGE